ncbi:hypothetical protein GM3708_513 [Geminocystis sp. NIES-3708]|uniref:DUF3298 domain-containing protein n=1 Tax=Geminocystis sp. NIES-3708 TaxID=1615909 RepID=UPI0005FCB247|nr:DUF3298 domain-containing protein [Geminocystis sp. NIES-3708]BAQ60107.1 hypothetical protein GM3708_513 [Geminocystis sp. NIES-3708]
MTKRPNIPAEIKRRVLVEAGHRCAIHTCKNPNVDIHHIIPWAKCQEHNFNNLIALCPNCHRRVHNGEIDQKSLLMYKASLVKREIKETDLENTQKSINNFSSNIESHQSVLLSEQNNNEYKYSIDFEYPHFIPNMGDLRQINVLLEAQAIKALLCERLRAFEQLFSETNHSDNLILKNLLEQGNAYASSFKIIVHTEGIITIRQSIYYYSSGAAHPNHFTTGVNYFRNPLISINLEHLFTDSLKALDVLSDYCIKILELENQDSEANEWVRDGAGRNWENYDNFVIDENGIIIFFHPYQVGSYAEGERIVVISSRFIFPLLKENTKLHLLWN